MAHRWAVAIILRNHGSGRFHVMYSIKRQTDPLNKWMDGRTDVQLVTFRLHYGPVKALTWRNRQPDDRIPFEWCSSAPSKCHVRLRIAPAEF